MTATYAHLLSAMATTQIQQAAQKIQDADTLVVLTGAGMGVDSGLPDFRGVTGFWQAYPLYEKLGVRFEEMANPVHFERDPEFAWGFYGHRLNLYRDTKPHKGFGILRSWGKQKKNKIFSVTSNVDGHFQISGFDLNWEVHGSLGHLQCQSSSCTDNIWPHPPGKIEVDFDTMRATSELPICRECGRVARPNILMFGDWGFIGSRTNAQEKNFQEFLQGSGQILGIEIGAGTAVPTIRHIGQNLQRLKNFDLIRINPRESELKAGLSIPVGGLAALEEIDELL